MRPIEISLNGYYMATTTRSRTCREAVAKVREIARNRPVVVAGHAPYTITPNDRVTANFKR
jgi:hypothetical protein